MTWLRKAGAGVRWLLLTELRMYVGVWRLLTRRHHVPPGSHAFRYVGAVSVLLWAFTILSAVELLVLHLILPWETVRLVADILGIWGVIWILGLTGCHYVYPHLVTDEALRIRHSEGRDVVTLRWEDLASVCTRERSVESSRRVLVAEEDGEEVLHVVVGSRTNVDLRLAHPLTFTVRGRTHRVGEVRLLADDPRALAAAVRERAGIGSNRRA